MVFSSSIFRGQHAQPHMVVEEALFSILNALHHASPSNSGLNLVYKGRVDCSNCPIPNPIQCMDTILRCFIYYAHYYKQLAVEEFYTGDCVSHHHYLRTVVSTAALGYFITNPNHLNYSQPFDGAVDLTPLPFWVSKVIKKLTFNENFALRFEYYEYAEIVEE